MPETYEGKIQMAKLQQQLSDHEATQRIDMAEIKGGVNQIINKLDIKAGKDEVEKVAQAIELKADKADVNSLSSRLWWLIGVLFLAGTTLIIWLIEESIKGRFKI